MAIYQSVVKQLGIPVNHEEYVRRSGAIGIRSVGPWCAHEEVVEITGPVYALIDARTGHIWSLLDHTLAWRDLDRKIAAGKRLSGDEAYEQALAMARSLLGDNMPPHLRLLECRLDEQSRLWRVTASPTFNGYDCAYYRLVVEFYEGGFLASFGYSGGAVNCPTEVRLSQEQALAAAKKAAEETLRIYKGELAGFHLGDWIAPVTKDGQVVDVRKATLAEKRIALVSNWRSGDVEALRWGPDSRKYRLAYHFIFVLQSETAPAERKLLHIDIDTATGECVNVLFM